MAAKYEKNEDAVTQPSGAANLMSALNFWLRWLGKSDDSRVGNELDADFDASLSNFCSHLGMF